LFGKGHCYGGNRISPSQFLMLVILRRGQMYGYEILKVLREEFKGLWEPQTGAVYPALKRLGEHGLVKTEVRGDKEYYALTEEGRSWVQERLDSMSIEFLFMTRYFDFMSHEANAKNGQKMGAADSSKGLPMNLRFMMGEEMSGEETLEHLRLVRKMLGKGLEHIEKRIAELEKENQE
jgi:DNA-binding PadR family transcriptional regulator